MCLVNVKDLGKGGCKDLNKNKNGSLGKKDDNEDV